MRIHKWFLDKNIAAPLHETRIRARARAYVRFNHLRTAAEHAPPLPKRRRGYRRSSRVRVYRFLFRLARSYARVCIKRVPRTTAHWNDWPFNRPTGNAFFSTPSARPRRTRRPDGRAARLSATDPTSETVHVIRSRENDGKNGGKKLKKCEKTKRRGYTITRTTRILRRATRARYDETGRRRPFRRD